MFAIQSLPSNPVNEIVHQYKDVGLLDENNKQFDGDVIGITKNGYIRTGNQEPEAWTGEKILDLSVNRPTTCWIPEDESAACGGSINLRAPGAFTQISAGAEQACALREDGSVACWGWGRQEGERKAIAIPDESLPEGSFKKISSSVFFTCGLGSGGTIECWFIRDTSGRGDPRVYMPEDTDAERYEPPEGTYKTIDIGTVTACAIRTDDGIDCWGREIIYSTLDRDITRVCTLSATGAADCQVSEQPEPTLPHPALDVPEGTFKAVDSGYYNANSGFACAVTTDDQVICWGQLSGEIKFE